jgi:hypothetical protein
MEPNTSGQGTPPAEATPEISAELDRLTALDPTALDDAAKQTLQSHYDFLTDEERTKFGIQQAAQTPPATTEPPKVEKPRVRNETPRGSQNSDFSKDPLYKRMMENQINIEVNQIVSQNEAMKPLEADIRKYAANPAYEQVPVDFIAKALAFDNLNRELTELRNGQGTNNGVRSAAPAGRPGSTVRTSGGSRKDWNNMNNDEFDQYVNKVRAGETVAL